VCQPQPYLRWEVSQVRPFKEAYLRFIGQQGEDSDLEHAAAGLREGAEERDGLSDDPGAGEGSARGVGGWTVGGVQSPPIAARTKQGVSEPPAVRKVPTLAR
jgi:hypothetical protein